MHCSFLQCLPLSLALLLVIANISFGSSAFRDERKDEISAQSVSVRSSDIPDVHGVARVAFLDGGNRYLRPKRDDLDPSNRPSPALIQRHYHIMDHLQLHNNSSSLAQRSLTGDLVIMGFQLIWDHADVLVSSYLAHLRTTEYYQKLIEEIGTEFRHGPTVQNYIITYGCLRLTFSVLAESFATIAPDLARQFPNGFGQFIQEFAQMMISIAAYVVFGTYMVLAYTVMISIWITMMIVDDSHQPDVITGP